MVVENGMMTMTQQMARTRTKPLTEKMKKEKIKAKKGDATVRITCSIDPGFESADFSMGWGAQLVWKAGGNLRSKYSAMTLSDIVGQVSSDIKKEACRIPGNHSISGRDFQDASRIGPQTNNILSNRHTNPGDPIRIKGWGFERL